MFNVKKVTEDLVEWIRNWFDENGKGCNAVIGISGGKDSSIVAGLCVKALGKDRVIGVLMPNGEQADIAEELLEEAVEIASPKTLLKVLPVTVNEQSVSIGNVEITYPYVRKMLLSSDKVAVYINTCGIELEEWALKKESDPLEGYIADAIKLAYLYHQGKPFREKIKQDVFPDDGHLAALNPGSLKQWPISEQKKLFEMLGGEAEVKEKIGVTLAESFLMHPTKITKYGHNYRKD